ncbi:MAG: lycopene cyclase domain-containing protein [Dehalococcoidia bacterium]
MSGHLTYLLLELGWSLPVLLLHWLLGGDLLWRLRRTLLTAVVPITAYLSAADAVAIHSGIWSINPARTLGLRIGSLVFEEVIFFFVTGLMVVQSLILFLDPSIRERSKRQILRLRFQKTKRT